MNFFDTNGVEHILADKSQIILFENAGVSPSARFRVAIPNWVVNGNSVVLYINQDTYNKLKNWIQNNKIINE